MAQRRCFGRRQTHSLSAGSPQGGVISPLIANIYLHETFDLWFEEEVKPGLRGTAKVVRYADDIAIILSSEQDAAKVMACLPERFAAFGLRLHPAKTQLIDFRHPRRWSEDGGPSSRDSFDLLGFTHYWSKSRQTYGSSSGLRLSHSYDVRCATSGSGAGITVTTPFVGNRLG